jgi:para-nitrobenzyl esterase
MSLIKVKVDGGFIAGVNASNSKVSIFKGIPYAAPPVGDLRWRAPKPVVAWEGVRKCDKFSSIAVQGDSGLNPFAIFYNKEFYTEKMPVSEDCLYLNVWTPAESASDKLPVMLWIHGGGFGGGYGHEKEFDGEGFARKSVILVTINYRLGIFGFLAHPELSAESENKVSGNYGILDQIAALKWVRENIEAFGGNPENITIFGQSAGAKSVETLICSPLTKGAINKAIMQSGGGINAIESSMSLSDAEKIGLEICSSFKVSSIQEMRKLPAEDIQKQIVHFRPSNVNAGPLFFTPNTDGYVLPADTPKMIIEGKHHDIPYLLGYNLSETEGFKTMMPGVTAFAEKQAELGRKPAYVYCFDRKLPGDDAGSFHSAELWYVFETLHRCWRPFEDVDRKLSNIMSAYWANFARFGNPNGDSLPLWEGFTCESPSIMQLGNTTEMIAY